MNREEKKQTLFSSGGVFVDIFIGFLIAACIAGIVYRCFIYDPHANDNQGESYMVYFEIEDAQPSFAEYLTSGDPVYDQATGLRLGALAVHQGSTDEKAVLVLQEQEQPLSVKGVFRSRAGELKEGSLVLDGTYTLTPGQVLEIYTDTVAVHVRILQITDQIVSVDDSEAADAQQTTEAGETTEAATE